MSILQFIQAHFVKSGEVIDDLYIRHENSVTILPIMKQTPRTIMKTAEIFTGEADVVQAPANIVKIFYTPNVRKKESDVAALLSPSELASLIG